MATRVKVVALAGRRQLVLRWIDPVTGSQRQRSAKTAHRGKAERQASNLERELARGSQLPEDRIPFGDFRDRYWEECLAGLAVKTRTAANSAFNHYQRLMKPRHLQDVTPATLATFAAKLRRDGRPKAETSIASYLRQFHAALSWAESIGLILLAPKMLTPRRAKGKHSLARGRAITTEEFERMVGMIAMARPRDAAQWRRLLYGLWLSGLRLEESLKLSWDKDASISIDLSGRRPRFRIWAEAEKGHKDRYLPMTPDFAEFVLETPEHERVGPVFSIVGTQTGESMTLKRVGRVISDIGRRAKVVVNKAADKFASAHDLRRSFGTRWSSRVKPAVLQLLMRHKSIETTLKYYVTHDADDVADGLWAEWGRQAESMEVTNEPPEQR